MLNRLRHRLGYLTLLLLFLPGLALTSVGEANAHGATNMVVVESSHHEHSHKSHGHAHDNGQHLSIESGSHFHEQADRVGANFAIAPNVRHALRLGERRGFPLRRVYRVERPPRKAVT